MIDELEEIRARHLRDDRWRNTQSNKDRAFLLDLTERQRAEIEQLSADILRLAEGFRASLDAALRLVDEARAENEKLRAEKEAMLDWLRRR